MKTPIQRALSLKDQYTIHSYAYVSLLDGGGTCCQNCGRVISNMVTLENQKGEKFVVGNDCASTLVAGLEKYNLLYEIEPAFSEGKSLRAKIMKNFKDKKIVKAYIWTSPNDGGKYLMMLRVDKCETMKKIHHPEISLQYIKDLVEM